MQPGALGTPHSAVMKGGHRGLGTSAPFDHSSFGGALGLRSLKDALLHSRSLLPDSGPVHQEGPSQPRESQSARTLSHPVAHGGSVRNGGTGSFPRCRPNTLQIPGPTLRSCRRASLSLSGRGSEVSGPLQCPERILLKGHSVVDTAMLSPPGREGVSPSR